MLSFTLSGFTSDSRLHHKTTVGRNWNYTLALFHNSPLTFPSKQPNIKTSSTKRDTEITPKIQETRDKACEGIRKSTIEDHSYCGDTHRQPRPMRAEQRHRFPSPPRSLNKHESPVMAVSSSHLLHTQHILSPADHHHLITLLSSPLAKKSQEVPRHTTRTWNTDTLTGASNQ